MLIRVGIDQLGDLEQALLDCAIQKAPCPLIGPLSLNLWFYNSYKMINLLPSVLTSLYTASFIDDLSQIVDIHIHHRFSHETEPHLAITLMRVNHLDQEADQIHTYKFPTLESRKQWAKIHRADKALCLSTIPVLRTWCRLCYIGIGVNTVETEVWFQVVERLGQRDVQIICSWCAEDLNLPIEQLLLKPDQVAVTSPHQIAKLLQQKRREICYA